MKFSQLTTLLPCQSLESFTLARSAEDAEELLSAWSAPWHPALVAHAQVAPTWAPADSPPETPSGHLVLLPACSEPLLPDGWLERAEQAGAVVLRSLRDRQQVIQSALWYLDPPPAPMDPDLVADFLALAYCRFVVELLTRQLRYMSNLDESSFQIELVAAAEAAVQADGAAARGRIQAAFDLLHQSREYFYPVESHLLDLTLVAPTTLGPSLRGELAGKMPTNLLISGEAVREMARREPETLSALASAVADGRVSVAGGEWSDSPLPLLAPEAICGRLERGLQAYQEHLGSRPAIFGRRRFGLTPVLPGILARLGFTGALHVTLDDGRFPTGNQSRVQWEGLDGTAIEALGRVPIDVGHADSFLRLPERLGEAMDLDHVATVVLAHWPGQSSPWYEDLRRITGYTTVLGTFSTLQTYFEQTSFSGQTTRYTPDQYRSPYLSQTVARNQIDPISRWVRYYGRRAAAEAVHTVEALTRLVGTAPGDRGAVTATIMAEIDDTLENAAGPADLDQRLQTMLGETVDSLARTITGAGRPDTRGCLVINPCSFSRSVAVQSPELIPAPAVTGPVQSAGDGLAMVEVPAMGFAWVGPGAALPDSPKPAPRRKAFFWRKPAEAQAESEPRLAEMRVPEPSRRRRAVPPTPAGVLRNEFFEAIIDPHTGAIRSLSDYRSRGPRLAQQLALRRPRAGEADPSDDVHYSIMAADEIRVTSPGPVFGEIVVRGRLVDREGARLAGFVQRMRAWRGSRVLELDIDLDPEALPDDNPWASYYAARFAWADETAVLSRGVNMASLSTEVVQIETPHFVDIRAEKQRTTLLVGGLPYHRRFGLRRLDTLLVVRGERARHFRLGIGVDLPHPMAAALDFLMPEMVVRGVPASARDSGWLFHVDVRNVVATCWEPLWAPSGDASRDRIDGFRVRLLETDGRRVVVGLRSFRAPASAVKLQRGDVPPTELSVQDDRITIQLGPHEWAEIEARFPQAESLSQITSPQPAPSPAP